MTFDDAFADNHSHALPILQRYEIPATFFVTTGLVDRDRDVIEARSWRGWRDAASTLTWDQIRELKTAGMEIGSHGHTHRTFAQLDEGEARNDLRTCKDILQDRLEAPVVSLAYPKGRPRRDFSERTIRLAGEVGYEQAGAVLFRRVRESDARMSIPRFPVGNDGLDMLEAKITGRFDIVGAWQERAPLWMLRALGG